MMTVPEYDLIPYAAEVLRGEKLLVLAPHPDDEAIGCGGIIAQHAREKRQVRVVIVSDGSAGGDAGDDPTAFRLVREQESIAGLAILGVADPTFLRLPDRHLDQLGAELQERIREQILQFKPDLILAPSPVEIHPDHVATSRALFDLIQRDEELIGTLALTKVAFYEVSQPIRPNVLVDITKEAGQKWAAIAAHKSQHKLRDYERLTRGLNQYRTHTLHPEAEFAEGLWVTAASSFRTQPWSELCRSVAPQNRVNISFEPIPISVVVRTRNRPTWLGEALDSIRATSYPAEVVVVNDGGSALPQSLRQIDRLQVVEQEKSVGRSEAMNLGVRAATSKFVAFLDDDDLYYPEHLETLSLAAQTGSHLAYYTDAVSCFLETSESGEYRVRDRMRLFANDFDGALLFFDNYIPLPCLLTTREAFLGVGGFDPAFDLFEDWDFLLRLAARGDFLRIPRVTCEIRHFLGGSSAVLSSPEGSAAFRHAKLQIWRRHRPERDDDRLATVLERLKRKNQSLTNDITSQRGRSSHLELDVARLDRDKQTLLEHLENEHRSLLEARQDALVEISRLQTALVVSEAELNQTIGELRSRADTQDRYVCQLEDDIKQKDKTLADLFAEIDRLNGLLELIYRSKTWKLHQLVEKVKGRP